jgi:hypothetical protein
MAKTVVIFGAGASKCSGAPLMREFLQKGNALRYTGQFSEELQKDWGVFMDAYQHLQRASSRINIDLDNIEEIWGLLEMAEVVNGLASMSGDQVKAARESLERIIVATIELSMHFPIIRDNRQARIHAPTPYHQLIQGLRSFIGNNGTRSPVAFLTFNYDVALDFALYTHSLNTNYYLESPVINQAHGVPLCKLHGSLNWVLGPNNQILVAAYPEDYASRLMMLQPEAVSTTMPMSVNVKRIAADTQVPNRPLIVPPTDSKLGHTAGSRTFGARHRAIFGRLRASSSSGFRSHPLMTSSRASWRSRACRWFRWSSSRYMTPIVWESLRRGIALVWRAPPCPGSRCTPRPLKRQ